MESGKAMHEHKVEQRKLEHQKELEREEHIIAFIESVIHQRPKGDFESFVRDAVILSKLMTCIVFNSVPQENIEEQWGSGAARDRTQTLIREMMRYGVRQSFAPEDLTELKNIEKVSKCVEELCNLASKDKDAVMQMPLVQ